MPIKSDTCFNQKNGEPLTEYISEYDAKQGAEYVKASYGHDLIPYRCSSCGKWHLSPRNRQTPSRICHFCKDSYGNSKDLYKTEEAAVQRAKIIEKEQGIKLKVYRCHYADGYHLTKNTRGRR